jgi:hypothetical protein
VDLLAVNAMTVLGSKWFITVQPILHSTAMTRPVNSFLKVLSFFGSLIRSHVWGLLLPIIVVIVGKLVLVVFHVLLIVIFGTHLGDLDWQFLAKKLDV